MKSNLKEAILAYAIKYQGEWSLIAKAIKRKEPYQVAQIENKYITIMDPEYPDCFKRLRYPPWILFYKGNLSLLKRKCIGVIGARNCSMQALQNTKVVVDHLKTRYCIVSGLAKGIDAMAHRSSIETIGIIGCGIDRIYPYMNKELYKQMEERQLILSEYPLDTAPLSYHFPWRNRLIAALSDSIVVIEATRKSGTMTTVNEALELSKTIYCLPTAFNVKEYEGCNYLISQGAMIVSDEKDLDDI